MWINSYPSSEKLFVSITPEHVHYMLVTVVNTSSLSKAQLHPVSNVVVYPVNNVVLYPVNSVVL